MHTMAEGVPEAIVPATQAGKAVYDVAGPLPAVIAGLFAFMFAAYKAGKRKQR